MIKEAYVSFEVAKLLKEKGFKEPCKALNKLVIKDGEKLFTKITHQKAMAWLREKNISIEPSALNAHFYVYTIYKLFNNKVKELYNDGEFDSYEEAVEAALKYVLENLI